MSWTAIPNDWNQLRALLANAEEGSFSVATSASRTTQPTIGKQVCVLETSLKIALAERRVTGQMPTVAGQELLDHAGLMGEAAIPVACERA